MGSRKLALFPHAELTTPMVRRAILLLEGDELPQRTLSGWQKTIAAPSVRWDRKRGREHACLWSLDDLARLRLIVRLRRRGGLSMPRVRALLKAYEPELRQALRPNSSVVLVVDPKLGVSLRSADALSEVDLESGQFRLPLASMYQDAEKVVARVLREVA